MSRFRMPLHERLYEARIRRERYQRDPDYRLKRVNERRVRSGLPPYDGVEAIPAIHQRPRGERGRFA